MLETTKQKKVREFTEIWGTLVEQVGLLHRKNGKEIVEIVENLKLKNKKQSLQKLKKLCSSDYDSCEGGSANHDPFEKVDEAVRTIFAKLYLERKLDEGFEKEVGDAFLVFFKNFEKKEIVINNTKWTNPPENQIKKRVEARQDPFWVLIQKWKENLSFDFSTLTEFSEQDIRNKLLEKLENVQPLIEEILEAVELEIKDVDSEVMAMIEEEIDRFLTLEAEKILPKGATIYNITVTLEEAE